MKLYCLFQPNRANLMSPRKLFSAHSFIPKHKRTERIEETSTEFKSHQIWREYLLGCALPVSRSDFIPDFSFFLKEEWFFSYIMPHLLLSGFDQESIVYELIPDKKSDCSQILFRTQFITVDGILTIFHVPSTCPSKSKASPVLQSNPPPKTVPDSC